jgi:periplasmic protein CpxP/Spy
MKLSIRLLLALVLSFVVCVAFAQGGGGGRGQGRRGGGTTIAGLLRRADVQADLAITDDQKSKLADLRGNGGGGGGGGTPPTPEERQARMAEQEKAVEAILTPAQVQRVHEIQIQLMGDQAVTLPAVQTALNLTDDQKAKVKDLMSTYNAANRSLGEKQRSGDLDADAVRTARTKNTETLKQDLHNVLTADQVSKLKDLGGKPFVPAAPGGGGR